MGISRYERQMTGRAKFLIETLGLKPHPEGGFFREIYRQPAVPDSIYTVIYFLITADSFSRFHRIGRDEIWHFHEGAALRHYAVDPHNFRLTTRIIGAPQSAVYTARVRSRYWQAALPEGEYTLVSCTVIPGFKYSDFVLLRDSPRACQEIEARYPELKLYF